MFTFFWMLENGMARLKGGFKPKDQPVVVLTDLAHCDQGLEVLIGLVGVDVMQGATVPGVPVGGCEINGYLKTHIYFYQ